MRDFFNTKKFKILLAVAVVLAGMMAWAGANGRLTNAPQELMGALLTPFQKAAQLLGGGVDGLLDKYVRIDQIIAENEQLQQENQELRDQLVVRLSAEGDDGHSDGSRPEYDFESFVYF